MEKVDLPVDVKPIFEQKMQEFNPYQFRDVQQMTIDGVLFLGYVFELGIRSHRVEVGQNPILAHMPEHYLYFLWLHEFAMQHLKHPLSLAALKENYRFLI